MPPLSSTTEPETVLPARSWARAVTANPSTIPSATIHPCVRRRPIASSLYRAWKQSRRRETQSYTTGCGPGASIQAGRSRFALTRERHGLGEGGQELAVDAPEPPVGQDDHAVA